MLSFILLRIFEVYGLMCDIQVSTEDHRFMLLKLGEKSTHCSVPFLTIRQSCEVILGIRDIRIDVVEILEFESECTTFIVSFRANTIHHGKWWDFREYGGARISWTLRGIEDALVSHRLDDIGLCDNLLRFGFDLLKTNNIRIQFLKNLRESFFHHSSDSVYVPRD
jgi:hypothetical protein